MKAEHYRFDSIPFRRLDSYIFQKVTDRRLTAIPHSHDFYEVIWLMGGTVTQVVEGRECFMQGGEAMILRPGETHYFLSQEEGICLLSLSVRSEEFLQMASAYAPTLGAHIAAHEGLVRFAVSDLPAEVVGESEFDCKYLLSFLLRACIEGTGFTEKRQKTPSPIGDLAAKMQEGDHLRQGIAAAIALSHYSQSHLSRLIRAHYGMGLKEWINDLRLVAAYRELILGDMTVVQIAMLVGFSSLGHFNKIFKRKFGITPAAARRQRRIFTV